MIHLSGQLICATEDEAAIVRTHLPVHVALTLAEPGCALFEVTQTADPLIWDVVERFTDRAAFEAHQSRVAASPWGRHTRGIRRDYIVQEA